MARFRSSMWWIICLAWLLPHQAAQAEDEPYIGEMLWVPYTFAPVGWELCNGQLLPISWYPDLFAVIGTRYGGDGFSNFALPDMRGRVELGAGQGGYYVGQQGGEARHTLTILEMGVHRHNLPASTAPATSSSPGSSFGQTGQGKLYGDNATASLADRNGGPSTVVQPHNNLMPYLTLNCIIAVEGIFPPR